VTTDRFLKKASNDFSAIKNIGEERIKQIDKSDNAKRHCICGEILQLNNGRYCCLNCFRKYNLNGRQVDMNETYELLDEKCRDMERLDIFTAHYGRDITEDMK
jgi:hypothetical protein